MSLIIYGNAILDTIYEVHSLTVDRSHECRAVWSRAGGIANACRAAHGHIDTVPIGSIGEDRVGAYFRNELQAITNTDYIASVPGSTSYANIIIDPVQSTRTSIVVRGVSYERQWYPVWTPGTHHWIHLMYLDNMRLPPESLQAFRRYADDTNSIISADISGSKSDRLADKLHFVDYLFADMSYWRTYDQSHVRAGVLLHNDSLIWLKSKTRDIEYPISSESGLNVLGAGDYLATNCILQLMHGDLDLATAHTATIALLHSQTHANKHPTAHSRQCQTLPR